MRWCSRCTAGDISAAAGFAVAGADAACGSTGGNVAVQAASSKAAAATAAQPSHRLA
jgi:hypothetical protein